jgi:VanZ family protein
MIIIVDMLRSPDKRDSPVDSLRTTERSTEFGARPAARHPWQVHRIAIAVLWTLVILALCWLPSPWLQRVEAGKPWLEIPDLDKVVHWGIFVIFTVLWLRVWSSRQRYVWVALAGVGLGALTEVVQNLPLIGRDGCLPDAVTDVVGVLIGLAIAPLVEPALGFLESRVLRRATP